MQEWTSEQWLKWQNVIIKEELGELVLPKKEVEKSKKVLASKMKVKKV